MKNIALSLIILLTITSKSFGETINLDAKYVETTKNVHKLTGLTSNESRRDVVKRSPLEITKYVDEEKSVIKLTAPAGEKNNFSPESSGTISFDRRGELVDLLRSLPNRMRRASFRPADNSEVIFCGDGVCLTFITVAKGRKVYMEFLVGDRTWGDEKAYPSVAKLCNHFCFVGERQTALSLH
jgi:hypothetical protein